MTELVGIIHKTFKTPDTWTAVVRADDDTIVAMFTLEGDAKKWLHGPSSTSHGRHLLVRLKLAK